MLFADAQLRELEAARHQGRCQNCPRCRVAAALAVLIAACTYSRKKGHCGLAVLGWKAGQARRPQPRPRQASGPQMESSALLRRQPGLAGIPAMQSPTTVRWGTCPVPPAKRGRSCPTWQKMTDETGAGGRPSGPECTLLSLGAPQGGDGTVAAGQSRACSHQLQTHPHTYPSNTHRWLWSWRSSVPRSR